MGNIAEWNFEIDEKAHTPKSPLKRGLIKKYCYKICFSNWRNTFKSTYQIVTESFR